MLAKPGDLEELGAALALAGSLVAKLAPRGGDELALAVDLVAALAPVVRRLSDVRRKDELARAGVPLLAPRTKPR